MAPDGSTRTDTWNGATLAAASRRSTVPRHCPVRASARGTTSRSRTRVEGSTTSARSPRWTGSVPASRSPRKVLAATPASSTRPSAPTTITRLVSASRRVRGTTYASSSRVVHSTAGNGRACRQRALSRVWLKARLCRLRMYVVAEGVIFRMAQSMRDPDVPPGCQRVPPRAGGCPWATGRAGAVVGVW